MNDAFRADCQHLQWLASMLDIDLQGGDIPTLRARLEQIEETVERAQRELDRIEGPIPEESVLTLYACRLCGQETTAAYPRGFLNPVCHECRIEMAADDRDDDRRDDDDDRTAEARSEGH